MKKLIVSLYVPLLATVITSCGGGSGSSDKMPKPRPYGQIDGLVTDSVISNATVDFYKYHPEGRGDTLAGSVRTNGRGEYSQSFQSESTDVLITARGGSYIEEQTGKVVNLGTPHVLKAIAFYESGKMTTAIPSLWSTVAVGYTECLLNQGQTLPDAIKEASERVSMVVGFPIHSTYPINPTHRDHSYHDLVDDSLKFGAIASGISKWTHDEAIAQGLEPHIPGMTSIDLGLLMYRDVQSDCQLDGFALRPDGSKYRLSFGKRLLDSNVYRVEIPRKMLEFMNSDKNLTRVGSQDLAYFANERANIQEAIYGDQSLTDLDTQGPKITINIQDGQYVFGDVKLIVNASDISGVNRVRVNFDGHYSRIVSGDESELILSSLDYKDGPFTVSVEATDGLSVSSYEKFTLNIQNDKPILVQKSANLVNTARHRLIVGFDNLPQGIAYLLVDGEKAEVSGIRGEIELDLLQGRNQQHIKLIDKMGQEHHFNTSVNLDITYPTINPRIPSGHASEQHDVFYLPDSHETPVKRRFSNGDKDPIYIARDRHSCLGLDVSERHLQRLSWPYVALEPFDEENDPLRADWSDLTISYSYRMGNDVRVNNSKRIIADGAHDRVHVPFCEEYLGKNWWRSSSSVFGKDQGVLTFKVVDRAGNESSFDFKFYFTETPIHIEPIFQSGAYLNANNQKVKLKTLGAEGIDDIVAYINNKPLAKNLISGDRTSVDLTSLKEGHHDIALSAFDEGKEVYRSQNMRFLVDRTPPKIHVKLEDLFDTYSSKHGEFYFDIVDHGGSGFDPKSFNLGQYDQQSDKFFWKKVEPFFEGRHSYRLDLDLDESLIGQPYGWNIFRIRFSDKAGNPIQEYQLLVDQG